MKKINYFCFALLFAFLTTGAAVAIEEELETIYQYDAESNTLFSKIRKNEIYTLDNYRESARSSSANIDAVTREDIQRQNAPSISQLLNQMGSVTTQTGNGSEGNVTTVRIRGTDRVRLTLDGIRADRPSMTTPGVESQFLLADDIELIEVIKGPQGNISGTNASGGAIAMQTRRGEGPFGFELGSDFGTYGTFKERAAIMGGNEKVDYYLSTTWYKTDGGMYTSKMGRIHNDDYNNLNVVSNFGYRLLDNKAELRNVFRMSRSRKGLGVGYNNLNYSYYNDPNNYSRNTDIMDSLSFKHSVNDTYDYGVRLGIYKNLNTNYTLQDDFSPDEYSRSRISSTRLNFMTQHNVKLADWNKLSIGYNLENENIDGISNSLMYQAWPNPPFPLQNYYSNYKGSTLQNDIYLNDVINIKDMLYIRGGARLVNNSQFGTYVTPNGSAALVLPTFKIAGAQTKLRGSWGQSVNTPTLYQRFGGFRDSFMAWDGNPNLKAEKMTSWDAGIEQSFFNERVKLEFGYFNSKYKDYISSYYAYDPVTYLTSGYYDNIESARIHGYEAKATFEPNEKIKLLVNYTYTHSQDDATGNMLPATPTNRINGTAFWTPNDRISVYAGIEAGSSRTMSADKRDSVPGYVDAKIGTSIKLFSIKDMHFYLRGNIYNLFNQNICMYKSLANDYYYAPRIRFNAGIFVKYEPTKKDKDKEKERV